MPAVMDDVDLSWVTFTDDEHELKCERRWRDCPNVAAFELHWRPSGCQCPKPRRYCVTCYEHLRAGVGYVSALCYDCDRVIVAKATPLPRA